jgi:hypothetical protein
VLWYETADDDAVFAALCGLLEGHS